MEWGPFDILVKLDSRQTDMFDLRLLWTACLMMVDHLLVVHFVSVMNSVEFEVK